LEGYFYCFEEVGIGCLDLSALPLDDTFWVCN